MTRETLLARILAHCRSVGLEPDGGFPPDVRVERRYLGHWQREAWCVIWSLWSARQPWLATVGSTVFTATEVARARRVRLSLADSNFMDLLVEED